jgi:hypothetical protein
MKLEWKNCWMHKEWQPMAATTMEEAQWYLESRLPQTEDGTLIRNVETGEVFKWNPPREPAINWGPF